jgi:2-polyprenyl-6-methoxyphenol hydroxylase-like FAD-dependent oxidoreductase
MSAPLPGPLPSEVDVVVVGAGGAGMCAALAAAKQGLETVLVERSAYFGGSTARSGGGVWMPGNAALRAAGQVPADDVEQAKRYLDAIVGDEVPKVRRDTYLDRGPEVLCGSRGSPSTPTTTPRRLAAAPRAAPASRSRSTRGSWARSSSACTRSTPRRRPT